MRPLSVLSALALTLCPAVAADPPKFDAKADLEKLRGEWRTDPDAKVSVRLEFLSPGLGLVAKPPGKDLTFTFGIDDAFELKQVDGQSVIRLDATLAKLSDVPGSIGYRFDKDALVVTFPEGDLKGEHRLTRPAKK